MEIPRSRISIKTPISHETLQAFRGLFLFALIVMITAGIGDWSDIPPWVKKAKIISYCIVFLTLISTYLSAWVRNRILFIAYFENLLVGIWTLALFWESDFTAYTGLWVVVFTLVSPVVYTEFFSYAIFGAIWASLLVVSAFFSWRIGSEGWQWAFLGLVTLGMSEMMKWGKSKDREKIALMATFPEFSYSPRLGINRQNQLFYANPAASVEFPGIQELKENHPFVRLLIGTMNMNFRGHEVQGATLRYQNKLFQVQYSFSMIASSFRIYVSDITESERKVAELEDREDMYRRLVDESNEGLILIDNSQKVRFVNQRFREIFHHEGVTPSRIHEWQAEPWMAEIAQEYLEKINQGQSTNGEVFETILSNSKGEDFVALINTIPYIDRQGEKAGLVASITDISNLKNVEQKLQERNQQMDGFLYKATHDLKGPLSSLKGLLSLALETDSLEEIQKYLELGITSVDRLDQALVDLLHVARINNAQLTPEKIHLSPFLVDIFSRLKHMPESGKVRLEMEVSPELELVSDVKSLESILMNLLVNAMKYQRAANPDPWVKITASKDGKSTLIEVSDNGEGIKPEMQGKIFEMFFRANRLSPGTGLGLYIVRMAAVKLGGTISLTSTYGEGSTFRLQVPDL